MILNGNGKLAKREITALEDSYLSFEGALAGQLLQNVDEVLQTRGGGQGLKLYSRLYNDPHIQAALNRLAGSVTCKDWIVAPGGEKRIDQKAADLVRSQLANLNAFDLSLKEENHSSVNGFDQLTRAMIVSGRLNGYVCAEVMWSNRGGQTVASEIRVRDPRQFGFMRGEQGYVLRHLTRENSWTGETPPLKKILVWSYGALDGSPYGRALGEAIFWPHFFKRNIIKFNLKFLENYASPKVVGKYPRGSQTDQLATLNAAVNTIANETGISIPETMMLEYLQANASGTVDAYEKAIRYFDEQISEVILGETGSLSQSTGGGSRARDEVGAESGAMVAKAIADSLSSTFNRLARWITDFNLPGAMPPTVYRDFEQGEEITSRSGVDKVLFDLGYRLTPERVADVYGSGYEQAGGDDKEPALISSLGVGGVQALTGLLTQAATGQLPKENAIAVLVSVFGIAEEAAAKMVPDAPKQEPDDGGLAGLFGGQDDEVDEVDEVDDEFAESEKDAAELIADKARPFIQDAIAPWLTIITNFVEQATSLEEIRDGLIDLFPEMDDAAFAEAMGQAMLLGDLAGREEVLQDNADVAFSEAIESALNGTLDFAAPLFGKGSRAGSKKPNCTAGKSHFCQTPNGRGSCVPMSKKCKFKPSGNTEKAADFVALVVLKKQIEEEINTRKIDLEYADENPSNEAISKWIEARMNAPMGHLEIIHEIANSERGEFSSHLVNVYPSARSYAEKNYKRKQGVTKKARIAELEAEWEAKYATQKAKLQAIDEKAKNGTKSARKEKWDLIFRALPIKAQLEGLKVRLNSGKRKGDIAAGRHYLKSIVRYKLDIEFDLPANYTAADLKSAYRRLAKKYHPDTGGSKEQFDRLTEAYERLSKTEFSEAIEAALNGTLDFAAKSSGGKKPNCNPAKSHFCQTANGRGSCVPLSKKCKFTPTGAVASAATYAGAKVASASTPAPAQTPTSSPALSSPVPANQKALDSTRNALVKQLGQKAVEDAENNLKTVLDNADIFVRVGNVNTLQNILGDEFKNSFQLGQDTHQIPQLADKSYLKARARVEKKTLGIDAKTADGDRPIYGYLGSQDLNGASHSDPSRAYGSIAVKLKGVKDRATFTGADSFKSGIASAVKNDGTPPPPNAASIVPATRHGYDRDKLPKNYPSYYADDYNDGSFIKAAAIAKSVDDLAPRLALTGNAYMETQIHGGVKPSDIAEIHFRPGGFSDRPNAAIAQFAKDNGVDLYVKGQKLSLSDLDGLINKAADPVSQRVKDLRSAMESGDITKIRSLAKQLDEDAQNVKLSGGEFDKHLKLFYSETGFDGLPTVGTEADVTKAWQDGGHLMVRGVSKSGKSGKAHLTAFQTGDYFVGNGIYGNGTYVGHAGTIAGKTIRGYTSATHKLDAKRAVDDIAKHGFISPGSMTMRMALHKDAIVVKQSELLKKRNRLSKKLAADYKAQESALLSGTKSTQFTAADMTRYSSALSKNRANFAGTKVKAKKISSNPLNGGTLEEYEWTTVGLNGDTIKKTVYVNNMGSGIGAKAYFLSPDGTYNWISVGANGRPTKMSHFSLVNDYGVQTTLAKNGWTVRPKTGDYNMDPANVQKIQDLKDEHKSTLHVLGLDDDDEGGLGRFAVLQGVDMIALDQSYEPFTFGNLLNRSKVVTQKDPLDYKKAMKTGAL